ncbi:hypothetical protein VRU48_12520 [Pedobacter sp. KR3-3]|uniref:Aspartyl protease n=1 Tax=Pedobacter albus TaxID=3113905 RepID=A0ABU7I981_9SPHI|nr:hypothetical protein [Pedobacter sp. KR3-3]MEE1945937.1 hypothetical protein [Pedobacter sp. KR3-3]
MPTLPVNQLVISPQTHTLPFRWQGDSIRLKQGGSIWEAHAAMLIPVKFKHCPRIFYLQFDLGSPYSMFYQNKIEAIQSKYPKSIPSKPIAGKLESLSFTAGNMPVLAKEIVVKQFDSAGINWNDKKGVEIIGTIGVDFIDQKVAVIDYPNAKLTLSEQIPEKLLPRLSLTDLIYSNRSLLFPAKVNDKNTMLFFDTGSSMFELLTNKETSRQLAQPDVQPIQYDVKSWGRSLTAHTVASRGEIELAGIVLPLGSTTYMEGASDAQVERMLKLGIGGMIGNKLLLNCILVLDTKNKKFGLVKER